MILKGKNFTTERGSPLPPGANIIKKGVQFSIFSRHATSVSLLLFHSQNHNSKYDVIKLDPVENKTGDIWHIWIKGIEEGQLYGYKIDGPYRPEEGQRYNKNKLIIDPYSRAITDNYKWNLEKAKGFYPNSKGKDLSFSDIESASYVPKSIVINKVSKIKDKPLNIPLQDTIIYELHVKGYTYHESSNVKNRGTYKGLTEKIPYLKELGITSVELLPIQDFDDNENFNINPITGERLKNFWGYSTFSFFAPKGIYSVPGKAGHQVQEFKKMVKNFHDEGIEVILDIVFNHTAEGDENGPTISFRGIDNTIYYMLKENKRYYKNFSGCGNTLNCNHPLVREFILDCLRYWVIEMNIDGFRFDLASILGRAQDGKILSNPPLIEKIEEDPILRNTKIIAEAWDAAGAYQVGEFPGRWAEWNGKFRDDVKKFWRGDPGTAGNFATRLTGSSDLYKSTMKGPLHSINFITCHDGFTLNDLVSFNKKHNYENGEDNQDGDNNNISYNFGIEGAEATDYIDKIRLKQIKNYIATICLSQGVPMLLAGDEFRRTQKGNNNSYCQDNETSWVNWRLLEENSELFRFTKLMIQFRKNHHILRKKNYFVGKKFEGFGAPDITWHGIKIGKPDWGKNSNTVAVLLNGEYLLDESGNRNPDVYIIFNASKTSRFYEIPDSPSGLGWKRAIDTSYSSPDDIFEPGNEQPVYEKRYYMKKLSVAVLITGLSHSILSS